MMRRRGGKGWLFTLQQGFNRSFTYTPSRSSTCEYGKGVYFARDGSGVIKPRYMSGRFPDSSLSSWPAF